MSASNMFSLMLHRIILVFTLITGTVNSGPNTYWSIRSGELRPVEYQGQEVLTKLKTKPVNPITCQETQRNSTVSIIHFQQSKVLRRNQIPVKKPNLKRQLDYNLCPFYICKTQGIFVTYVAYGLITEAVGISDGFIVNISYFIVLNTPDLSNEHLKPH